MKLANLALISTVLFATVTHACVNGYELEITELMQRADKEEIAKAVANLETRYASDRSPTIANDLGATLILAGDYNRAVEALHALETEYPGLPKTAANLGTALELSGNNEEALRWITEGIKRDSTEHSGTEWLHVKILEAKLAIAKDAHWLESNSVLGISFGNEPRPRHPEAPLKDHLGKELSLEQAHIAIEYQLRERLKFVSFPDPVVGDLYFSWGDIGWLLGRSRPPEYYNAALLFGSDHQKLIERRRAQFFEDHPQLLEHEVHESSYRTWVGVASAVLTLAALTYFYVRHRRRKRQIASM